MKKKTERYNFNKDIHLDVVASHEELLLTSALNDILFEDGNVVATNRHALVVAPIDAISNLRGIDIMKLEGERLNYKLFKILLKYNKILSIDDIGIEVTNDDSYTIKLKFTKNGMKYPNYKNLFNDLGNKKTCNRISFDSGTLNDICYSVGHNDPILKYNGRSQPLSISFIDSKIKGLLCLGYLDDYTL